MTEYEYWVDHRPPRENYARDLQAQLNLMGLNGWRLVHVITDGDLYVFERPRK